MFLQKDIHVTEHNGSLNGDRRFASSLSTGSRRCSDRIRRTLGRLLGRVVGWSTIFGRRGGRWWFFPGRGWWRRWFFAFRARGLRADHRESTRHTVNVRNGVTEVLEPRALKALIQYVVISKRLIQRYAGDKVSVQN